MLLSIKVTTHNISFPVENFSFALAKFGYPSSSFCQNLGERFKQKKQKQKKTTLYNSTLKYTD